MRVLHVLYELKFSGAEIMYVQAAPIFRVLGAELSVLDTSKNLGEYAPYFEKAGYQVLHRFIPTGMWNHWRLRHQIISFLRNQEIDVVHVHRNDLAWIFAYCCHRLDIPCVYTYHSIFPSHWYSYHWHILKRWMQRSLWKQRQTTISDAVYQHELEYYHNPTHKIYNWWGYEKYYPAEDGEKEMMRKQLGIPSDALTVISVGGCSHIKRHQEIIQSLPLILKVYPNLIYLHLGSGEMLQEEVALAESLNVADHIRFMGNQADVRKFLICSDIYVMTSMFEGISLTTIEAMACHIPCLLYDVPGLRDFNREGEASIIVQESPEALSRALCELYADKEKQKKMIQTAHQYIHKKYLMAVNARKIFDLYAKEEKGRS